MSTVKLFVDHSEEKVFRRFLPSFCDFVIYFNYLNVIIISLAIILFRINHFLSNISMFLTSNILDKNH